MNDLSPEEYAILEAEEDSDTGGGFYSIPRECPCGQWHLSRDLYWQHRVDHEAGSRTVQ